jgi:hypothetical protein
VDETGFLTAREAVACDRLTHAKPRCLGRPKGLEAIWLKDVDFGFVGAGGGMQSDLEVIA